MTPYILMKFFITLIALIDPLSILPLFINYSKELSKEQIKKDVMTCGLVVFVILSVTIWLGSFILNALGVDPSSFSVAGGLVLIHLGFQYLANDPNSSNQSTPSFAIYPLAIPLLAGPGAMTTIVIYANLYSTFFDLFSLNVIILIITLIIIGTLYASQVLKKVFGKNFESIATPILGILIIAMGAEMVLKGVGETFHWL